MPVNSFDDYPMSWKPDKEKLTFPIYYCLADMMEHDIKDGVLSANTKLPPQKGLADFYSYFSSAHPYMESYYQWLKLPEGCSGRLCESELAHQGIGVFGAEHFSVDKSPSAAVSAVGDSLFDILKDCFGYRIRKIHTAMRTVLFINGSPEAEPPIPVMAGCGLGIQRLPFLVSIVRIYCFIFESMILFTSLILKPDTSVPLVTVFGKKISWYRIPIPIYKPAAARSSPAKKIAAPPLYHTIPEPL